MTLDKNLIAGFLTGVVLGIAGARYISLHKDELSAKLKFKSAAQGADQAKDSEMTLEELESQKERLEDLIAEIKSRQENPNV